MHIKKFTQFILENEYYEDINEGDIVPGVLYNTGFEGTGKEVNRMYVTSNEKVTEINFKKGGDSGYISLQFYKESDPLNIPGGVNVYASVMTSKDGDRDASYGAGITKMDLFDADKSEVPLMRNANSIDLLADFMNRTGISNDPTSGTNLAKVITTLLLSTTYNAKVTDTFIKFAKNISRNVSMKAFIPRMSRDFVTIKQDPGMKAFVAELPKSYDALSPKKA